MERSEAMDIAVNLGCSKVHCDNLDQLIVSNKKHYFRIPLTQYGVDDNTKMVNQKSKWRFHNKQQAVIKHVLSF